MVKSYNDSIEGECVEQHPVSYFVPARRRRYYPLFRHHHHHDPLWNTHNSGLRQWPADTKIRLPVMDFKDRGDKYVLTAEVPGVNKDDINITITENRIRIQADNNEEHIEEGECYVCQERTSMNYHRTFEFPEDVNSDLAEAKLENGVLSVDLPKKESEPKEGVKKIEVK